MNKMWNLLSLIKEVWTSNLILILTTSPFVKIYKKVDIFLQRTPFFMIQSIGIDFNLINLVMAKTG